jgi:hypothetical protein
MFHQVPSPKTMLLSKEVRFTVILFLLCVLVNAGPVSAGCHLANTLVAEDGILAKPVQRLPVHKARDDGRTSLYPVTILVF